MSLCLLTGGAAPPTPLEQLEAGIWDRIRTLGARFGGLPADTTGMTLTLAGRLEIFALDDSARAANGAGAIGIVRFEEIDPPPPDRAEPPSHGRYHLRLEDRRGTCAEIVQEVLIAATGIPERGERAQAECKTSLMADVVRRARRIASLPLSAGRLDDNWSVAAAATGFADVYADSIVVRVTKIALRAHAVAPGEGIGTGHRVDSLNVGLAMGADGWSVVRRGTTMHVATDVRVGTDWERANRRFTIPIDSTFKLRDAWPVVEVYLAVQRTPENPAGLAWTYGHAPSAFFRGLSWPP